MTLGTVNVSVYNWPYTGEKKVLIILNNDYDTRRSVAVATVPGRTPCATRWVSYPIIVDLHTRDVK